MNFRRNLITMAIFVMGLFSASAQITPVSEIVTTTLSGNAFARDTRWYTFHIGASGYLISQPDATADHISLSRVVSGLEDKDLWCFVGNNEQGYEIFNKAAGANKVLSAPAQMSGTTGATAFVVLKDRNALNGYRSKWKMVTSSNIAGQAGFYLHPVGAVKHKINNRDGKLAFWDAGADAGSTVRFAFAQQEMPVNLSSGAFAQNSNWNTIWRSKQTAPRLELNSEYNNMTAAGTQIAAYRGKQKDPQPYTIDAGEGNIIVGFSFDFQNHNNHTVGLAVKAGDVSMTSSTSSQHLAVADLNAQTAVFSIGTDNKGIVLNNFYVKVRRFLPPTEPSFTVFDNFKTTVPYRIPAIATAHNGNLIAMADYRHTGADIGMAHNGRLDLHMRIGRNNGKNWDDVRVLVNGKGANHGGNEFYVAFGDPCIVADRESPKVLVLSCAGNVSFFNGTRERHQSIAHFVSNDNGESWSEPIDLEKQFYEPLDNGKRGPVRAMFIGSGKIHQSRYTKVGNYYRLYCSTLVRDVNNTYCNYVYYSDDFGSHWKLLGSPDFPAIPSNTDEPKVEELPDGSVICSGRTNGGRQYSLFRFTDAEKGQGYWEAMAFSGNANKGTVALGNSTNGEILILPAVRKEDKKVVYLALQSVPFGSGRSNVGIYYKELDGYDDYKNSAAFAANWDGRHQASHIGSAYTTMTLQKDHNIGFFYEEEGGRSGGYNMVYKNYSVEHITGGRYTHDGTIATADRLHADIDHLKGALRSEIAQAAARTNGSDFFSIPQSAIDEAQAALDVIVVSPESTESELTAACEKARTALQHFRHRIVTESIRPKAGDKIVMKNRLHNTKYLGASMREDKIDTPTSVSHRTVWELVESAVVGAFYLYNPYLNRYIQALPAKNDTPILLTSDKNSAAPYLITNPTDQYAAFSQINPLNADLSCIHMVNRGTAVRWRESSEGSQFVLTKAPETFEHVWLNDLRNDLAANIDAAEQRIKGKTPVGNSLGEYNNDPALFSKARQLVASSSDDVAAIVAAIKALDSEIGYCLPKAGKFYRFIGSVSGKYIDAVAKSGNNARMNASAGNSPAGIFYLDRENRLLAYATGTYFFNASSVGALKAAANRLTFALPAGNGKTGRYTIYAGDSQRWLYDNGNHADSKVDRNSTYADPHCDWIIEEVTALPVTLSDYGYTTLYAPVALRIPQGLRAYVGSVSENNTHLRLTEIQAAIPAHTAVLLEGVPSQTYALTIGADDVPPAVQNALKGGIESLPRTSELLTLQNFDDPGFYRDSQPTVDGFRAFLPLPSSAVDHLLLDFGNITGLSPVAPLPLSPSRIYDLSGRRREHLQKGFNIVDGRKVYVE